MLCCSHHNAIANFNSLHLVCSQESMVHFKDLGSIIQMLATNVSNEEFLINVRRDHVLEDALRSVLRKSFSCRFSLKVRLGITLCGA